MVQTVYSPLRSWLGGKYRLAKTIIPLIPAHRCYIEPFAGAAWVLFRKEPSKVEVLNDINGDIVNLYRCVKHHHPEIIRQMSYMLPSRAEFERLKRLDATSMTDIERAVRFLYCHRLSFGGKIIEQTMPVRSSSPIRLNASKIAKELEDSYKRLQGVLIENLNYSDLIRRYDKEGSFFYIDPPYWNCEDFYGKGIFVKDDFYQLAEQLQTIKGKFILSLNDVPAIREIFAAFNFKEVKFRYSGYQSITAKELLISNFVLPNQ